MRLNNGLLHALQLAGGSGKLAQEIGVKKQTISFILHNLDGYCPIKIKDKIRERYGLSNKEFEFYTNKPGLGYVTQRFINKTILMQYKDNRRKYYE